MKFKFQKTEIPQIIVELQRIENGIVDVNLLNSKKIIRYPENLFFNIFKLIPPTYITHRKRGDGRLLEDKEKICRPNELLIKFDNPTGRLDKCSEDRAFSIPAYIDIVFIKDCMVIF